MRTIDSLTHLVESLNLGSTISAHTQLSGGSLHKMWHIKTPDCQYAIKEINQHIAKKGRALKNYELSEHISHLFQAHGVSAISALQFDNRYVQQVDNKCFIIYPFVDGMVKSIAKLEHADFKKIGHLFASLHQAEITVEGLVQPQYDVFEDMHWVSLIEQASLKELGELLDNILHWNHRFQESLGPLNQNLVITHRDLHPKNVLWDKHHNPYIIDWEACGLMNPILEVIGYGIEWGDLLSGNFQKKPTLAVYKEYHEQNGVTLSKNNIENAFFGWLGHCVLGWTEFNIRRMIGKISSNSKEIELGQDIIRNKMVGCLQFIKHYEDKLISQAHSIFREPV